MTNRPDPVQFAKYSYYLAFASATIIFIAFVLSFFKSDLTSVLVQVVWFALITGGIGTFLAYAARSDFKRSPGPDDAMRHARIGWRVNLGALLVVLVFAALIITIRIIAANNGN